MYSDTLELLGCIIDGICKLINLIINLTGKELLHISSKASIKTADFSPDYAKWAASWQNQQNDCAPSEDWSDWAEPSKDSDQPLGICPAWSESLLSTWRKLGSLATHWVLSKDSAQTGRTSRLIWVFAGRTVIFLAVIRLLINALSFNCLKYPESF